MNSGSLPHPRIAPAGLAPVRLAPVRLAPVRLAPVRVWLLLGKFGGDNAQVLGLGDHLAGHFGWDCTVRRVRFHPDPLVPREKIPAAIDFSRSDRFDPPWPDVVIACGRFYGAVAAWLKRRAAAAGHRTVQMQFGRIAAPMADFDLIAATAQYGLPAAPNFVPLTLPIVRHDRVREAHAVAAWSPRLAHLPRPWTVILAGGVTSVISFGETEAAGLAARSLALQRAQGGSLIAVFARRTPQAVRRRIAQDLAAAEASHLVVDWPAPDPNPYPALLALGDRFLVTCDSASMIADAALSGKPIEIFPLPIAEFVTRFSARGLGLSLDARRRRRARAGLPPDLLDRGRDGLVRRHWMRCWDEIRDYLQVVERNGLLGGAGGTRASEIQAQELNALGLRLDALVAAASAPPHPL